MPQTLQKLYPEAQLRECTGRKETKAGAILASNHLSSHSHRTTRLQASAGQAIAEDHHAPTSGVRGSLSPGPIACENFREHLVPMQPVQIASPNRNNLTARVQEHSFGAVMKRCRPQELVEGLDQTQVIGLTTSTHKTINLSVSSCSRS